MGHRDFRGNDGSALGRFDDAWRFIDEGLTAVETTKERGGEINRIAGEIALMSPEPDAAKAEEYFKRSLAGRRQTAYCAPE
jgi:hypothetical protein